jgi:hypothetical protein
MRADIAARNIGLETVMREWAARTDYQKALDDAADRGSTGGKQEHER